MRKNALSVYSEIGKLNRILLHRPGWEVENLTPSIMERLLFDDIPYLKVAREEHDRFAEVLRSQDIEVLYLEDLVAEVLKDKAIKEQFIDEYLKDAEVKHPEALKEYFSSYKQENELVDKLMAGLRVEELPELKSDDPYFHIDPMPNLYFTRDPFALIGRGVSIHRMKTATRRRETLFGRYIFDHHPDFKMAPRYYDRTMEHALEGGDILILSPKVLAVGISERTSQEAIQILAENILLQEESFERILGIHIPNKRAFMHLDTVFTMVDVDKFTIHPEVEGPMVIYNFYAKEGKVVHHTEELELNQVLEKYLEVDHVELIRCGGKAGIDAEREQWNDGSNTLAIAPGEVVVYERNHVTNRLLEERGIKLHYIPSSELSRGRGGPRCMSMSLNRDNY